MFSEEKRGVRTRKRRLESTTKKKKRSLKNYERVEF